MTVKGHNIKEVWQRGTVRKNFFTKTAGQIWDEIQTANPHSWHVTAHNRFTAEKDRK